MTTRTEQETRRGAPVRGAAPATGARAGQRRPEPPHPAKPVPQPRTDTARRRSRADDPLARPSSPRPGSTRGTDSTSRDARPAPARGRGGRAATDARGRAAGTDARTRGTSATAGADADARARGTRGAAGVRERAAGAEAGGRGAGVRERAAGAKAGVRGRAGAGSDVREERGKAGTRERVAGGAGASRTVTERPRTGARKRPHASPEPRRAAIGRPVRRQRAPFVLLVVGLLCGGLVTLLLLNTVLAQDSMTASNLVDEISTARQQNEDLQRKIEEEKLPGRVAERAEDLGLRRDWNEINTLESSSQAGPAR